MDYPEGEKKEERIEKEIANMPQFDYEVLLAEIEHH